MQIQRCAPLLNGALVGRSPLTRSVAPSRLRSRPVRVLPKRGRLPAGLPPLLAALCLRRPDLSGEASDVAGEGNPVAHLRADIESAVASLKIAA